MSDIGYQVIGSGPIKVVVLHGWLADSSIWNWAIPYLNTNDFTYAFMDYRGYGLSRNLPADVTIEEMAKDGLDLAKSLGWEKFHILGHSMGGAAAQYAAGISTGQVKSIVALTPIGSNGFPIDEGTMKGLEGGFNPEGLAGITQMVIGHEMEASILNRMVQNAMVTIGSENIYRRYLHNWTGAAFKDMVTGCTTPAFALAGGTDPLVTKTYLESSFGRDFVKGRISVMEGVGHYPMVEKPIESVKLWEAVIKNNE